MLRWLLLTAVAVTGVITFSQEEKRQQPYNPYGQQSEGCRTVQCSTNCKEIRDVFGCYKCGPCWNMDIQRNVQEINVGYPISSHQLQEQSRDHSFLRQSTIPLYQTKDESDNLPNQNLFDQPPTESRETLTGSVKQDFEVIPTPTSAQVRQNPSESIEQHLQSQGIFHSLNRTPTTVLHQVIDNPTVQNLPLTSPEPIQEQQPRASTSNTQNLYQQYQAQEILNRDSLPKLPDSTTEQLLQQHVDHSNHQPIKIPTIHQERKDIKFQPQLTMETFGQNPPQAGDNSPNHFQTVIQGNNQQFDKSQPHYVAEQAQTLAQYRKVSTEALSHFMKQQSSHASQPQHQSETLATRPLNEKPFRKSTEPQQSFSQVSQQAAAASPGINTNSPSTQYPSSVSKSDPDTRFDDFQTKRPNQENIHSSNPFVKKEITINVHGSRLTAEDEPRNPGEFNGEQESLLQTSKPYFINKNNNPYLPRIPELNPACPIPMCSYNCILIRGSDGCERCKCSQHGQVSANNNRSIDAKFHPDKNDIELLNATVRGNNNDFNKPRLEQLRQPQKDLHTGSHEPRNQQQPQNNQPFKFRELYEPHRKPQESFAEHETLPHRQNLPIQRHPVQEPRFSPDYPNYRPFPSCPMIPMCSTNCKIALGPDGCQRCVCPHRQNCPQELCPVDCFERYVGPDGCMHCGCGEIAVCPEIKCDRTKNCYHKINHTTGCATGCVCNDGVLNNQVKRFT